MHLSQFPRLDKFLFSFLLLSLLLVVVFTLQKKERKKNVPKLSKISWVGFDIFPKMAKKRRANPPKRHEIT